MKTFILSLAVTSGLMVSPAYSAVTAIGQIIDDAGNEITEWATTTPKTLDLDGDNMYGSWAGEFVGVVNNNAPNITFISIGSGNSVVGPFAGYATGTMVLGERFTVPRIRYSFRA